MKWKWRITRPLNRWENKIYEIVLNRYCVYVFCSLSPAYQILIRMMPMWTSWGCHCMCLGHEADCTHVGQIRTCTFVSLELCCATGAWSVQSFVWLVTIRSWTWNEVCMLLGACSGYVHNILHYKVNWLVQGHRSGNGHPSLTQEPLHTLKQACKLRIGKIFVLFNCNVTVHFLYIIWCLQYPPACCVSYCLKSIDWIWHDSGHWISTFSPRVPCNCMAHLCSE